MSPLTKISLVICIFGQVSFGVLKKIVKLHSELADLTQLQLVLVKVDFVLDCHNNKNKPKV